MTPTNDENQIGKILKAFVTGETKATARSIGEKLISLVDELPQEAEDGVQPGRSWKHSSLYDGVLKIAKEAHDDPQLAKLVKVLKEIKEIGPDANWKGLSPLGMMLRKEWNGGVESHGVDTWTNLNGFAARLSDQEVLDLDAYGIWAMRCERSRLSDRLTEFYRSALEDHRLSGKEGELDANELDNAIPAAAVWIMYAGGRMYELGRLEGGERGRIVMGGPRWHGREGYSTERWKFWKGRFEELCERKDLASTSRNMAARAHELMGEIEN